MNSHRSDIHSKQVGLWEEKNAKDLTEGKLVLLFSKAFKAIEQRSLMTLSSVTVLVVADRVLHETKSKHPLLAGVMLAPEGGIDFTSLIKNTEGPPSAELSLALRDLLVEFLNILGNITAEILTGALHRELSSVTCATAFVTASEKPNRDKK